MRVEIVLMAKINYFVTKQVSFEMSLLILHGRQQHEPFVILTKGTHILLLCMIKTISALIRFFIIYIKTNV